MMSCSRHRAHWMRRARLCLSLLAVLCAAGSAVAQENAQPNLERVRPGDSWLSLRARMCPLEELQAANPALAQRLIQPGDLVQVPFVGVSRLLKLDQTNRELRGQLEDLRNQARTGLEQLAMQRAELERSASALAERESQLSTLASNAANAQNHVQLLGALAALLGFGALGAAAWTWRARQELQTLQQTLRHAESRYWDLQRGLTDIDLELQRRMLRLLRSQGARVFSQEQVEDATAPVIELASRVQQRHSS